MKNIVSRFRLYILPIIQLSIPPVAISSGRAVDLFSDSSFFPVAVWLQSPSNATAYKATGVNLYVGLWEGPTRDQLDKLKSSGMPVLCNQNEFALANLETYEDVIAGWMHGDEPDNAQSDGSGGYGPCIDPDTIIARYARWKSNDPERPVYLNLGQGVSNIDYIGRGSECHARTDMYPRYIEGCDIASYDIYPVNSRYDLIRGNLWYVAKGIDSLRMWCDDLKETWCWIECTRIDSSSSAVPLPDQVKAEVWMALIHGAKGFGYFCHSWYGGFKEAGWLNDAEMKGAITAINTRIAALAPVLNSTPVSGTVTVEPGAASSPVAVTIRNHAGSIYIFAVAMRGDATSGTFSISGLTGTTSVEVLDEYRTLTAVDGMFQDDFSGYGVHLYKVNTTAGVRCRPIAGRYVDEKSPRIVPVIQGRTRLDAIDKMSIVYTIHGRCIKRLPDCNSGEFRASDCIYILQVR